MLMHLSSSQVTLLPAKFQPRQFSPSRTLWRQADSCWALPPQISRWLLSPFRIALKNQNTSINIITVIIYLFKLSLIMGPFFLEEGPIMCWFCPSVPCLHLKGKRKGLRIPNLVGRVPGTWAPRGPISKSKGQRSRSRRLSSIDLIHTAFG